MLELGELYQGQPAWPNAEGVPEGPQRKNHVMRPLNRTLVGDLVMEEAPLVVNARDVDGVVNRKLRDDAQVEGSRSAVIYGWETTT